MKTNPVKDKNFFQFILPAYLGFIVASTLQYFILDDIEFNIKYWIIGQVFMFSVMNGIMYLVYKLFKTKLNKTEVNETR